MFDWASNGGYIISSRLEKKEESENACWLIGKWSAHNISISISYQ